VLLSNDSTTLVYDLRDEKWSAVISNGSGGMGKNVHVEFGADEDEVLVWSDFAACVKVWCLKIGRAVEIRDPKYSGKDSRGWSYRPAARKVLALLCRASGVDVLLLLASRTYTLLSRVELATIDAANIKWSRDGRWIAVWDAASTGYNLYIYTADGHLYRTITREPSDEEWGLEGLGIKTVDWLPGSEKLAVGGWDRRVRILSTRTFAPLVFLDHTSVINVPSAPVYTEHTDNQGHRNYALTSQPATPPPAPLDKNETGLMKHGVGLMAFNADGSMCATRYDSAPSTVWIWDLCSLKTKAVLVQGAPVRSLMWHPSDATRLMVQTALDGPVVYVYTAAEQQQQQQAPGIFDLSAHISAPSSLAPRCTAQWLPTPQDKKPIFILAHQAAYIFVWPAGKDQILRFAKENGDEGEGESDDSLFDILTGRTPVPRLRDVDVDMEDEEEDGRGLEDTFREKRGRGLGASGAGSLGIGEGGGLGLDDSGLDEMF
jgi:hypothetical protein